MYKSSKQNQAPSKASTTDGIGAWFSWQRLLLIIIPLMIYGKSFRFEFTDSDRPHITENRIVQDGFNGISDAFLTAPAIGEIYRPLTMTTFALEKSIFDSSAKWAHIINLFLYLILLQLLFSLLKKLLTGIDSWLSVLLVLLFALHPVHADVVGHVDNRHEILAMLFGILAWNRFLNTYNKKVNGIPHLAGIFGLYALALFSSPSALVFLLAFPIASIFLNKVGFSEMKYAVYAMLSAAIIWGSMRFLLTREPEPADVILPLQNILYSAQGFSQSFATGLAVLLQYIILLAWPVSVSHDYSFAEMKAIGWGSAAPYICMALCLIFGFIIYKFLTSRRETSFASSFLLITLLPASQIFTFASSTVDKSLLFLPSLSFILLLFNLAKLVEERLSLRGIEASRWLVVSGLVLCLFYGYVSSGRVADWQDNLTLYKSGVANSPKSAVMQYNLGFEFLERAAAQSEQLVIEDFIQRSVSHLDTSIMIYPENHKAWYGKGAFYAAKADTLNAISSYKRAIQIRASSRSALNNLGVLYMGRLNFDSAYHYFNLSHQLKQDTISVSNLAKLFYTMGLRASGQGEITAAIDNYKKCLTYEPRNIMALNNIATIYANRNEFTVAQQYLFEALKANPNDVMVLENIAVISYLDRNMGQAIEYANRALRIDPSLKRCVAVLVDSYRSIGDEASAQKYKQQYDALQ